MELMEAIRTRRSVRKYTPDSVSDADVETVLDAARWAPSWANTQCVRWIVVRDAEARAALAGTLSSTNPANDAIRTVPVVFVACAETGRAGFKRGEPVTDKGDWYMYDAASAAHSLTLAAHALGLGTVHVGFFDTQKAQQIVGVPDNVRVVELIPMGHPAEQPHGPGRKELSEIVYRERYGQR